MESKEWSHVRGKSASEKNGQGKEMSYPTCNPAPGFHSVTWSVQMYTRLQNQGQGVSILLHSFSKLLANRKSSQASNTVASL